MFTSDTPFPNPEPEVTELDRLLSDIRTGSWIDAQTFPPLQWAVQGLIPEGFGLVIGPPKLGKSWFVLGQLLAIAAGGRALGRIDVEARPVLYLALEDGDRRMQSRIQMLNGQTPTPEQFHYHTTVKPDLVIPLAEAWLLRHPTGVVALDTLGKVMPPSLGGESAYQRDYRIGGDLKRLTDDTPGSTLLVVHHVRKQAGTDWMDSTSGTNGLNGSADWTLSLERGRSDDTALIRVTGRDVTENEYAATMREGRWTLAAGSLSEAAQIAQMETKKVGVGDDTAEVIDCVAEFTEGARAKDIAEKLGWKEDKTRTYLARAEESGRIERISRGLYTTVTSVTSVTNPVNMQVTLPVEDVTEHHAVVTTVTDTPEPVTQPLAEPPERNTNNTRNTPVEQPNDFCCKCGDPVFSPTPGMDITCPNCIRIAQEIDHE